MNPTILLSAQTGLFNFDIATSHKENSEFRQVIDLERDGFHTVISVQICSMCSALHDYINLRNLCVFMCLCVGVCLCLCVRACDYLLNNENVFYRNKTKPKF